MLVRAGRFGAEHMEATRHHGLRLYCLPMSIDEFGLDQDLIDEIAAAMSYAVDLVDPPNRSKFTPLPHFKVPPLPWFLWMLFGGRGSGKTAHAAKYVDDHVHGPPCLPDVPGGHWISIVAPTLGDAVTSCVQGPSGLRAHDPGIKVLNRPGGLIAQWSNGTEAKLFGANSPNDVERFRAGGNRCLVWCEEMAAWRYLEESWQQIRYGLRVGPRPHAIASTTPRSRALIKRLIKDDSRVHVSHGSTKDNPHLNTDVRDALYEDYAGTRMGRQELDGELLEDVEGALWNDDMIERNRINEKWMQELLPEDYHRVVVAVDPAASEHGDEHGIITAGMTAWWDAPWLSNEEQQLSHGFVLEDATCSGSPTAWGRAAISQYHKWKADCIVAEVNNGGDMVVNVIHSIDNTIPVVAVHATRGKLVRAEPISTLYEKNRVHHVGSEFMKLEDQMTGTDFKVPDPDVSPDRLDALVWAMTELMIGVKRTTSKKRKDKRLKGRR